MTTDRPVISDPDPYVSSGDLFTDTDQAWRLAEQLQDRVRFVDGLGWLGWNDTHWVEDPALVQEQTKRLARQRVLQAIEGGKEDLVRQARRLEDAGHIAAVMRLAESDHRVRVGTDALDADPWLLNVENGTIDLRTGVLRGHDRADLITKLAPVAYDPAATHPALDRLLAHLEAAAPGMDGCLARLFGMSLTGDCSAEILPLIQGDAGAGKTAVTEAFAAMLGAYAVKLPFESFCVSRHGRAAGGAQPDLVRLRGARFACAAEGDQAARLDAGMVKQLTGNERISARRLYGNPVEFAPTAKLWLVSNYDPACDADDSGLWRRIIKLVFPAVAPEHRDPALKSSLINDPLARSALLAWAVRGCRAWLANGGGRKGLALPPAIAAWTEAYRAKQDQVGQWWVELLADEHHLDPQGHVTIAALRNNYETWATENGFTPVQGRRFNEFLVSHGLTRASNRINGFKAKTWRGISAGPGISITDQTTNPPGATSMPTPSITTPEAAPSDPLPAWAAADPVIVAGIAEGLTLDQAVERSERLALAGVGSTSSTPS